MCFQGASVAVNAARLEWILSRPKIGRKSWSWTLNDEKSNYSDDVGECAGGLHDS
jgi:hypothetical protein